MSFTTVAHVRVSESLEQIVTCLLCTSFWERLSLFFLWYVCTGSWEHHGGTFGSKFGKETCKEHGDVWTRELLKEDLIVALWIKLRKLCNNMLAQVSLLVHFPGRTGSKFKAL